MPNAMDPKYEYERAAAIYPDPNILFDRDPDWKPHFFYKYRAVVSVCLSVGLCRPCHLYMMKKPMYSGIQRTILYFVIGAVLGYGAQHLLDGYVNFRSQVHRHYIALHPERFPPPKKELIGDQFRVWIPERQ